MHDVKCFLLSKKFLTDEDGNVLKDENGREKQEIIKRKVPIISVERVWKDEYYKGNAQGLRPSKRFKISSLNYKDEERLIYMGKEYELIRVDSDNEDEVVLVCQRRSSNVKKN